MRKIREPVHFTGDTMADRPATFTRADITAIFLADAVLRIESFQLLVKASVEKPELVSAEELDKFEHATVADLVSLGLFYEKFGFTSDEYERDIVLPAKRLTGVRFKDDGGVGRLLMAKAPKVVDMGFICGRGPDNGFLTADIWPQDYNLPNSWPMSEAKAMTLAKLAFAQEKEDRDILLSFDDGSAAVVFDGRKRNEPHPENR